MGIDVLSADEIRTGLRALQPEVSWCHHFHFGHGIETVSQDDEKFYNKATGLGRLASLLEDMVRFHTRKGDLKGMRVLDIASAEGLHSITMAKKGAEVLGIEGRSLYIDRARFAARILGCESASFIQGDVRTMDVDDLGEFDLVLCSGILHHLGQDSFKKFLGDLAVLSSDTLIMYTHVSTPESIKNHNLKGPIESPGGYEGYLFQEHREGTTKAERIKKVRSSLDNTMSFWATPESLVRCLGDVGFRGIYNILKPHIFHNPSSASYRLIVIARK